MSVNYEAAMEYLDRSINYGIKPGLERINRLADALGNPQQAYPAIHITGTNGKTSTSKVVGSILSSLGWKVGLYTSPHLERITERISIDGEEITTENFADLVFRLRPEIEKTNLAGQEKLTYFEILTALAFLYFQEQSVDCAVVEVGMGGCWDATNLVRSRVAIVTNVELEHTDYLGDSVEAITEEKVGIIKPGAVVITGEKKPEVLRIIEDASRKAGAHLKVMGQDFDYFSQDGSFEIKGLYGDYENLFLHLRGEYQRRNATLAAIAAEAFLEKVLPEEMLREVFAKVTSPGRLEVLQEGPLVVLDGAHNPHGAETLSRAITAFDYDKLILVIAILADKDVDGILKHLVPLASYVVVAENSNSRSLGADELLRYVGDHTRSFESGGNVASAVKRAMEKSGPKDLVLITGSLYTVGEARTFLRKCAQGSRFEAQGQ